MFYETTLEIYEKLARKLSEKGIRFEVSDCTLEKDSSKHIHMEFGNISKKTAEIVAKLADECSGFVAEQSKQGSTYGRPVSYEDKQDDTLEIQ